MIFPALEKISQRLSTIIIIKIATILMTALNIRQTTIGSFSNFYISNI